MDEVTSHDNALLAGRFLIAAALATGIAFRGIQKKSLSFNGGLAALVVGTITVFAGWRFAAALLTFFYSSSALTKYRGDVKKKFDGDYKEGGQRDAVQVMCNGLWGTIAALGFSVVSGASDPLDFRLYPQATLLLGAFIGSQTTLYLPMRSLITSRHYSACAGDTWASELGVLATSDPHLILTGRRVPRGTNGAISVLGTMATVLGGAAIGVAFFVAGGRYSISYFTKLLILSAACGGFGSIVDSILGATLQYSGFCLSCTKVINDPDKHPKNHRLSQIAGTNVLSNNTVNCVSALAGAVLGAWLSTKLFN